MPATADRPARSAAAHPGRAALPEDLSAGQREMIETGLRYVRSSLTMEICEPTSPFAQKRDAALDELHDLERRLGMKPR